MAPPATENGKGRDLRQDCDEVTNMPTSVNGLLEEGSTTTHRTSARMSLSVIGIANDFRPPTPTTPTQPSRPVSPLTSDSSSPSPQEPQSQSPPQSPSLSPSTPPQSRNYRSSIAKGPPIGVGLGLTLGGDDNNSSDVSFNPNTSRFNRSDSSASSHSSGGSPYRSRISQISFSYPRRSPSAASNQLRPAHPYGLYQQTTFEEPEDPTNDDVASSSVGLNAQLASFSRVRGADGEELDVIGPDGHAEQLPPYTRYPLAGPSAEKRNQPNSNTETLPSLDTANTGSSSSSTYPGPVISPIQTPSPIAAALVFSTTPVQPDPVLAEGHLQSHLLPESQSPTSTALPATPPTNGDVSRGVPSSASSLVEAKDQSKEPWHKKGRRKVLCGTVPLWSVLLFAILCIFLAVIAGGVIGGMLSQQRTRNHRDATVTVTNPASMWPASPIAAPTGLPKLPTGTFFFPLGAPGEQERRCIEPSRDTTAWGCSVTNQLLMIDFSENPNFLGARIYPAPVARGLEGVQYGAQPPKGNPTQKLQWVQDLRDTGRGPALYFQTLYDKVVIIEGEKFPSPDLHLRSANNPELTKRGWSNPNRKDYEGPPPSVSIDTSRPTRYASNPGEEPWYCFWNGTKLEGFIYVKEDIPGASTQSFTASQPINDDTRPSTILKSGITLPTMVSSSSMLTPQAPQVSARAILGPRSPGSRHISTSVATTPPARFPYIVKIDERRYPTPLFRPYCQKMIVNADGIAIPKLDSSGHKIVEYIKETTWGNKRKNTNSKATSLDNLRASSQQSQMFRRALGEWEVDKEGTISKRDSIPTNGCHCQWVSPFG